MVLLFPADAHADTYEHSLAVVADAPIGLRPGETTGQRLVLGRVGKGLPDQDLPSSWSRVSCRVDHHDVVVTFASTASDWPTSWPERVTCVVGEHTVAVSLLEASYPFVVDVPASPVVFDLPSDDGSGRGKYAVLDLPPAEGYRPGRWRARLSSGARWSGVDCTMAFAPDGRPTLSVLVRPDAPGGDGACHAKAGAPSKAIQVRR